MQSEGTHTPLDTPSKVTLKQRMGFLPYLFGNGFYLAGEQAVFNAAHIYGPDFAKNGTGLWEFYTLPHLKTGFMAPQTSEKIILFRNADNHFKKEVTPEVFGILCTLFGMSYMLMRPPHKETIARHFEKLREYAFSRPDGEIFCAALD